MAEGFSNRRALVTGAAGGIGSSLCRLLTDEGADVVALDWDEEGLQRLYGTETHVVDVTDARQVDEVMDRVGAVDVLVNNAGITALGAFRETPETSFREVIEVNLVGSAIVTRAAIDGLVERNGRIAVLSSVAGFAPLVHRTAYSASKHGLHGLFESLRAELANTGVTVTMICPTFVDSGIAERAVSRAEGEAGDWTTTGRHLTTEQVAHAVLDGLRHRRRLVLPGGTAKLAYTISRVAPSLYELLMRKRIAGRG